MKNKRKHDRIDKNMKAEVHAADRMTFSKAVNISQGGIFISTPEPLSEGSMINLALQIPSGELIEIKGQVKWIRQDESDHERTGMGIEFVEVSEKDISVINKFLD
jgi:uncharacterized protein (TIGR02266 family)